jgi:hypothetical protein
MITIQAAAFLVVGSIVRRTQDARLIPLQAKSFLSFHVDALAKHYNDLK